MKTFNEWLEETDPYLNEKLNKWAAMAAMPVLFAMGCNKPGDPQCKINDKSVINQVQQSSDVQINGNQFTAIGKSHVSHVLGDEGEEIAQEKAVEDAKMKVSSKLGANPGTIQFSQVSLINTERQGKMVIVTIKGMFYNPASQKMHGNISPNASKSIPNKRTFVDD